MLSESWKYFTHSVAVKIIKILVQSCGIGVIVVTNMDMVVYSNAATYTTCMYVRMFFFVFSLCVWSGVFTKDSRVRLWARGQVSSRWIDLFPDTLATASIVCKCALACYRSRYHCVSSGNRRWQHLRIRAYKRACVSIFNVRTFTLPVSFVCLYVRVRKRTRFCLPHCADAHLPKV